MRFCQSNGQPIRMAQCALCPIAHKCSKFLKWHALNKREYTLFVYRHVNKFPDKYSIGGIFMATPKKQEPMALVFEGDKLIKSFPKSKLINLSQPELTALQGKRILEATSKELELIYKITIKSKNWNGKL